MQTPTVAAATPRLRLAHLWLLVPLAVVFTLEARDVIETFDFWWNAKSGEWMVQNGRILMDDILVYSPPRPGPYYNPQWLSQVILYALFAVGPAFLLFFRAALFTFVIGMVVWHSLRRSNSYRLAGLAGVLAIFTCVTNFGVRPQMLIFPIFITYYFLLFGYPYRGSIATYGQPNGDTLLGRLGSFAGLASGPLQPTLGWKVFLLPPLMVLWVNMHGSYFLGLLLIGIYVAMVLFDHLRRPADRAWLRSPEAVRQGVAFLLTGVAVFVNPYVFGIIDYFFVATGDPTARRFNTEWQPPTIYNGTGIFFTVNLVVFVASIYFSRRRLTLADVLITAAFIYLSLLSLRNVIWWGLVSGPIIAANFAYAFPAKEEQPEPAATENLNPQSSVYPARGLASGRNLQSTIERPLFNYLIAGTLLAVCLLFLPFWRYALFGGSYFDPLRPQKIAEYLRTECDAKRLPGNILNYMEWGGYLEYRLYPCKQLFLDGRFEARSEQVWQDYIRLSSGYSDWQTILNRPEYPDIRYLVLDASYQKNLFPLLDRPGSGWRLQMTEYKPQAGKPEPLGYLYVRDP